MSDLDAYQRFDPYKGYIMDRRKMVMYFTVSVPSVVNVSFI